VEFSGVRRDLVIVLLTLLIQGIAIFIYLQLKAGVGGNWAFYLVIDSLIPLALSLVLGCLAAIIALNVLFRIGSRLPKWLWGIPAILVAFLSLFVLSEETLLSLAVIWIAAFGIHTIGSTPLWLSMGMLIFLGGLAVLAPPGALMLGAIYVIGLRMYPNEISIKRFLRPSRGVV
jgi:hypothetical protein